MTHRGNLFSHAQAPAVGETMQDLLQYRQLRIERILSSARIDSGEYQQEQDEWVVLLEGHARLEVRGQALALTRGDYVFLPAGTPHRVIEVSEGALWLAVHLYPDAER